jgi:serine protease Do
MDEFFKEVNEKTEKEKEKEYIDSFFDKPKEEEKKEFTDFVVLDDNNESSRAPQSQQDEEVRKPLFDPYTGERLDAQPQTFQPPAQSWDFGDYDTPGQTQVIAKKKLNKGLKAFIAICVVALIVSGGITVGFSQNWFSNFGSTSKSEKNLKPDLYLNEKPVTNTSAVSKDGKLSIPEIAKKVKPSVVGVLAYHKGQSFQATSQGSGIILSADGYIVTNAHVLFGSANVVADGVNIVLDNNDKHEAQIIGYDTRTDLAVLKINAKNLVPAVFGDSEKSVVGESVVAVGNPSGLELAGSVTSGIISAVNRVIQYNGSRSMKVIQTDAAVNPGNSGGALVNEFGQVIAINSAGKNKTEYEGINFAIPSAEAKPIIDSLIENRYVKGRVRMGIAFTSIDEVLARVENVPTGLKVVEIEKDMDVYAKGIRVGDIITKLDGKTVITTDDIDQVMKNKKPGDTIKVSVYRFSFNDKGTNFDVDVNLVEDKTEIIQ